MRALCGQTVLRFPSPDAISFEDSLALARDFVQRWRNHDLIVPAPAPHAPYTCTSEILRECAELAAEFDVPLHTHLAETTFEVEESRRQHGMPVIPYVKKQGLFGAKVLAAHCVHVDEGEIRGLQQAGAGVAHNPTSNLKLGAGIAPVARMPDFVRQDLAECACFVAANLRGGGAQPLPEDVHQAGSGIGVGQSMRVDMLEAQVFVGALQ